MKLVDDEKVNFSIYLVNLLLPILKRIDKEQVAEREVEAKIKGNLLKFCFDLHFIGGI